MLLKKFTVCCLTLEGSWPAGHCRHAHPFPHRDCTAAVPPQPNSWKTQKHTRESEEEHTRVDTLFFLHNRAHKSCAYLPRGGQELSSKGGSSSSSMYSSMYIWSKERTGEGLIIKHDQFTRIYEILNAVNKNKKKCRHFSQPDMEKYDTSKLTTLQHFPLCHTPRRHAHSHKTARVHTAWKHLSHLSGAKEWLLRSGGKEQVWIL